MGSFLAMGATMLLMAAALALPVLAPLAPLCAVVGTVRHKPPPPPPPFPLAGRGTWGLGISA